MKSIFQFIIITVLLVSCSNTPASTDKTNQINSPIDNEIVTESLDNIATETPETVNDAESALEEPVSINSEQNENESDAAPTVQKIKNKVESIVEKIKPDNKEVELPKAEIVTLKPNHDKWDALLRANVSSSGKVNYSGMNSSMNELSRYIKYLESFATRNNWTKNEKLAFWINLYNAATVRLICENYPIQSITKLSGGKPWDDPVVKVGLKNYTLNNIENDIIRPKFKDARIHFAVNCAAKSCPKIMNSAFTSDNLSRKLNKQTKSFINSSQNEITADKVVISKIFDWYKVDFKNGNVIEFLNKYSDIAINENATIEYKDYNWDLNK